MCPARDSSGFAVSLSGVAAPKFQVGVHSPEDCRVNIQAPPRLYTMPPCSATYVHLSATILDALAIQPMAQCKPDASDLVAAHLSSPLVSSQARHASCRVA